MQMKHLSQAVWIGMLPILILAGGCRWEQQETIFTGSAEKGDEPAPAHIVPAEPTAEGSALRTGDYPDERTPGSVPVVFAPGFISTGCNERDIAFSPEGDLILFSLGSTGGESFDIVEVRRRGELWESPRVAPFSSDAADIEPFFTPEGDAVYFVSNRPSGPDDKTNDWNIWTVRRQGGAWGDPMPVSGFAHSDADEYYPSLTRSGALYFTAALEGGFGGEDLYRAPREGDRYGEPENLGAAINSSSDEFNAWVDPDEKFIIFSSYGRDDDRGGGDLYISYRDVEGGWTDAVNMGDDVNSASLDYCPAVSRDGRYFFFSSRRAAPEAPARLNYPELMDRYQSEGNGLGDIYWMDARFLKKGIQ